MSISINDQTFPKEELLKLIKKSKIRAIRQIKKLTHIGSKDAKAIVNNLAKNPNYYENLIISKATTGFKANESSIAELKNDKYKEDLRQREPIVGAHFLKANRSNKLLIFGLIDFVILCIYFFLKDMR